MAIKIKVVNGEYCPTPFCDECGREIEGPAQRDSGAYVYVRPASGDDEGKAFEMFLVHKNYAKNGDRCMDRFERRHRTKEINGPLMGWDDLDSLAVFIFNNPGFRSERADEKYRVVNGKLRGNVTDSGF